MDQLSSESIKDFLFNTDQRFRELAKEHRRYEQRLTQLASLSYPSDEELVEEKSLKKQKLYVKDQMELILRQYRSDVSH
jgi:uncharacterized protein